MFTVVVTFIGFLLLVHEFRGYLFARTELSKQLRHFSIEDAACFCETDRETVYRSIRRWFGELGTFNELVRGQVHDHVIGTIGAKYHFPLVLTFPVMLVAIVYNLDYINNGEYHGKTGVIGDDLRAAICNEVSWALILGSSLQIALRVTRRFPIVPKRRAWNGIVTVAIGCVLTATMAGDYFFLNDFDKPFWLAATSLA